MQAPGAGGVMSGDEDVLGWRDSAVLPQARDRGDVSGAVACGDQEMLCTAAVTGLSPLTSSSVWCRVPGSPSRAAMTAATSARGIVPAGTGGAASRTWPVP